MGSPSRTRWRATWKDSQARWCRLSSGELLTVFRNPARAGWRWCVGGDGIDPVFGGPCRTRELAKAAVLAAAGCG